jgi:hypothetical protein
VQNSPELNIERNELFHFDDMESLITGQRGITLTHHVLRGDITICATETRAFALALKPQPRLFEIKPSGIEIIQDTEGIGATSIVPGAGNRVGVVTEGGDTYIMDSKGIELLELPSEDATVRLVGLGSGFVVIVTQNGVWAKGDSTLRECTTANWETNFIRLEMVMSAIAGASWN